MYSKSKEEFRRMLHKAMLIDTFGDAIREGASLSDIKKKLREFKINHSLSDVIDDLISSEILVEQQISKLMEEISIGFVKEFPDIINPALILFGSGAHGGGVLRSIRGNFSGQDVDWTITYEGYTGDSEIDWKKIKDYVHGQIKDKATSFGFSVNLSGCHEYNGEKHHYVYPTNVSEWHDQMVKDSKSGAYYKKNLFIVFHPSFPRKVNEQARKMALEALSMIYHEDETLWEKIITDFMATWRTVHNIQTKHIRPKKKEDSDKFDYLLREVATSSIYVMSYSIEETLRQTKSL